MATWLSRRVFQAFFIVVAMSIIVFLGVFAIGDPVEMLVPPDADQIEKARAIAVLGLDQPVWKQYFTFVVNAARGDFGNSFVFDIPALQLIVQRLPATLELAVFAVLLSVVIGIPLGIYSGLYPDQLASRTIMAGSILGFSLPSFWVGLVLIMFFGVYLGWLPSNGRGDTVSVLGVEWSFLTSDGIRHMLLPALNLSLTNIAMVLRLTRAGVREALQMDYVKFARAKGLHPTRIVGVHVLKNIMIPIVTVVGLDFGSTIAFSVVTENIYAWPGMGKLIIDSINVLDRPVMVAYLILVVVMFAIINLIVDVVYMLLDPRVRGRAMS